MKFRSQYWSCTKFAGWLRGTKKPSYETLEGWDEWRKNARAAHPFRYWLAEELLDKIQNVLNWVPDILYQWKYYFRNRFVIRSNALTASPIHVKPGEWCDLSERLLYCAFNELVDFIEVEKAWMMVAWNKELKEKYKIPATHRSKWFRWSMWRCKEAGLDYLKWEMGLVDDYKDSPTFGQPTAQAEAAKAQLELYEWWTTIRPARIDPYDLPNDDGYRKTFELEKQYDDEDTAMLIKLVQIRKSLWT